MDVLSSFYPNLSTTNNLKPRIFGCVSFVHIRSQNKGKLDPRALRCVFAGYSSTQKGYKCYHPPSKKFFVSRDVTFNEQEAYFTKPYLPGESLREDKENHLTLPDLPNLDQPESDPKSNEATQLDVRFGKGLVYTRKSKAIPKSIQVQESDSTPSHEVTISDLHTLQDATNLPTSQDETETITSGLVWKVY